MRTPTVAEQTEAQARPVLRYLCCGALTALALGVWLYGFSPDHFRNPDAYDYAQMGRELHRGHGFATLQIFPRHVPFLAEHGHLNGEHWPELYRPPLPIIADALPQLVGLDARRAGIWQTGICFILSVPVLFLLAWRTGGLVTAVAVSLLFIADPYVRERSYDGMSEPLAALLLFGALLAAFHPAARRWSWVAAGALAGLAYLARPQFAFVAPLLVVFAGVTSPHGRRWRSAALVAGTAIVVTLPWLVRNSFVAGDPLFSFSDSRNLVLAGLPVDSDLDVQLHAPVAKGAVLRQYGETILKKWRQNLTSNAFSVPFWDERLNGALLPIYLLFLVALSRRAGPGESAGGRYKWLVLALLVANLIVTSVLLPLPRFYWMFRPLVLIAATRELIRFGEERLRWRWVRTAALVLLIAVVAYPLRSGTTPPPPALTADFASALESLRSAAPPNAVVASDRSYQVAMLTDRRSLRLPAHPQELLDIDGRYLRIDYVLLSGELLSRGSRRPRESMYATYADYPTFTLSPAFTARFEVQHTLGDGSVVFRHR